MGTNSGAHPTSLLGRLIYGSLWRNEVKKHFNMIGIFALLFSNHANSSECIIADKFQGYSAKVWNALKFDTDGMTSTQYVIYINGDKSNVVGSNMEKFFQTSENSILSISEDQGRSVVETWSVFQGEKKVVYTKTTNGYGPFDGVNVFVGKVVGDCKPETAR